MVDGSYCLASCCMTCQHVAKIEWRSSVPDWYCGLNGGDRPRSGSVYMGENFISDGDWESWRKWATDRCVECVGWCKNYCRKDVNVNI